MANAYLSLGGITDSTFPDRLLTQSAFNAFMATNLPEAIDKSGPVPVIDYSKLLVSKGTLPHVTVTTAVTGATGITVGYKTNVLVANVSASDQVTAFAKTKSGELIIARKARGGEATGSILIPYTGIDSSQVECCYLLVTNADGKNVSTSTFDLVS